MGRARISAVEFDVNSLSATGCVSLSCIEGGSPIPSFYFTQLLALALGLEPELCHLELNGPAALNLLKERDFIAPTPA